VAVLEVNDPGVGRVVAGTVHDQYERAYPESGFVVKPPISARLLKRLVGSALVGSRQSL
jgi:hypothetical protein